METLKPGMGYVNYAVKTEIKSVNKMCIKMCKGIKVNTCSQFRVSFLLRVKSLFRELLKKEDYCGWCFNGSVPISPFTVLTPIRLDNNVPIKGL